MLTAKDIRGVYAIIPTPAKDDADRIDAIDTVDLVESARLTDALIRDGANGIIILGTTGEIATLTPEEIRGFVDCVLSTAAGRVPVFVGCTSLGTHEVVQHARFAQERGAAGIMLGLPMWQPLSTDMAVRFYAGISELFPDLPIMAYANPRAFRHDFGPDLWQGLAAHAPTVICAKFSNPATFAACHAAAGGKINLMPHEGMALQYEQIVPGALTACWSTSAAMGPEPAVALMNAALSGDMAAAEAIAKDLHWTGETVLPIIRNHDLFTMYNIQIEKTRFSTCGYCKPGPIRPPYDFLPDDLAEAAREVGYRWAKLRREKYAAPIQSAAMSARTTS